jgi:heme-degrading monooxygenase HmoA
MSRTIQLFVDMAVDPAKEQEMLRYFDAVFRPAARKFQGFIDVRILKLRSTLMGKMAAGVNYRFSISYESEELRQKWIASEIHIEVWGQMEKFLSSTEYTVVLFDVVA